MSFNIKSIAATYDKISEAYEACFSEPSDHLDDFVNLVERNCLILDAGCGPGIDSAYLTSLGCRVVGVDISAAMLELAKNRVNNAKFVSADIRTLRFDSASFDGIVASCSLIHVPKSDLYKTILGFHRMLVPQGVLYVRLQEGTSQEINAVEPFDPNERVFLNIVSFHEIEAILKDVGFELLNVYRRDAENQEEFNFSKLTVIASKHPK